jgi:hypothetical protein
VSAASAAAIGAGAAKGDARRIGILFMVGSACFAVGSLPAASSLSATSMTLVGALCFLWGARILVKPPPWLLPSTRGAATQPA